MPKNNSANTGQRTVAVMRFSALGDVVMTIPVVYSVCRSNPGVRFVMVTKAPLVDLFVNRPDNLEIFGADVKNKYTGVTGLYKLYSDLAEEYPLTDIADLHDVTRTKIIRFIGRMHGMRVAVIDKGHMAKRSLINRTPGDPLPQLPSSFERYSRVFGRLGLLVGNRFDTLFAANEPLASVETVTAEKLEGERWIGIAPFAAHKGKIYPQELMVEVVEQLASQPHTRIFMFGAGEEERDIIRQYTAKYENVVSLAEWRNGFPTEFALLRRLDVMLSMDSANMHLASVAGVPVASIWGQTHPCCGFAGWREDGSGVIAADMPCRPCSVFGNRECRRKYPYHCLRSIAPAEVVAKINEIISRKKQ